jgi:hypothetical protein
MPRWRKLFLVSIILAAAFGFAGYVGRRPMDFRVYYYGARGVFDGTRPVYGPTSGLGWPMHYRYPPLFLLLFAPFTLLPLAWSAGLWVLLKFASLFLVGTALCRRMPRSGKIVSVLFIAPYLIEEFRYGNAQFFVFALAAASLLLVRKRPLLSSGSLALAISIKVWPLFFIPYLAVRQNWRVAAYTLLFVAVLAMAPAFYFGFGQNLDLLSQWLSQESHTQLSESEIWFPNQSLRGFLMRYLTVIDYSQVPDANYAQVNIAALDPAVVRAIWLGIVVTAYAAFLWLAGRRRGSDGWLDHGLAFCLIAILEPFTQKYALAILLWPALAAGELASKSRFRWLFYAATILALIQPLAPGAGAQRLLQVLGLDFAAAVLLTALVAAACLGQPDQRAQAST